MLIDEQTIRVEAIGNVDADVARGISAYLNTRLRGFAVLLAAELVEEFGLGSVSVEVD